MILLTAVCQQGKHALAGKLNAHPTEGRTQEAWYPLRLQQIAEALLKEQNAAALADSLPFQSYASPFLQALLLALSASRCACNPRV